MTAKTTKTMTETEITQLVGEGPYTLVKASKDVLRDGLSPSCELCRTAIVKGLVFRSAAGREFVVGCDCVGRAVSRSHAQLSPEAKSARLPLAPDVLVQGVSDRAGIKSRQGRAARTHRSAKRDT